MDKAEIYNDLWESMGYKLTPENTCSNCTSAEEEGMCRLVCALNPIYKFETQPGATCAWFNSKKSKDSLNNLNR